MTYETIDRRGQRFIDIKAYEDARQRYVAAEFELSKLQPKPREWRVFREYGAHKIYMEYQNGCSPDAIIVREVSEHD